MGYTSDWGIPVIWVYHRQDAGISQGTSTQTHCYRLATYLHVFLLHEELQYPEEIDKAQGEHVNCTHRVTR